MSKATPAGDSENTFTVFTPTYNRADTLHRVYESLKTQTFRDFEWLIIDDGSTDGTAELAEKWQQEAAFPIRYLWQENQGKHVAFNHAVREARGRFFSPLDSDDACVPSALERFKYHWEAIPADQRGRFSGVAVLCQDQHGRLVGKGLPKDVLDSDSLEIKYKYKVTAELWGFHRTDVLRQYPFPEVEGASFVPESLVWNAIARRYKILFVNEPLRIYYHEEGGQADQLTRSGNPAKHALVLALWHRTILNNEIDWFRYAPGQFMRSAAHYARFSFHAKASLFDQIKKLDNLRAKLLYILMCPAGLALFLRDRRTRSRA